uniref:Uncharacterized protein n=1 Tax=Nelumbo nucifera TaxID=4432 RepID=A0A822YLM0_NELNU|nr:TPA_asm: hypothetical protein HUJ06_011332 [Nelumbo nucifera]
MWASDEPGRKTLFKTCCGRIYLKGKQKQGFGDWLGKRMWERETERLERERENAVAAESCSGGSTGMTVAGEEGESGRSGKK